jgi:hypothetical protein
MGFQAKIVCFCPFANDSIACYRSHSSATYDSELFFIAESLFRAFPCLDFTDRCFFLRYSRAFRTRYRVWLQEFAWL